MYIGLMSGTSLDGVDAVLADMASSIGPVLVKRHEYQPFSADLRQVLLSLNSSGPDELHQAALAANALSRCYADAVHALLKKTGCAAADVRAIGAHGQTVRHRPGDRLADTETDERITPALLLNGLAGYTPRIRVSVVKNASSSSASFGGRSAGWASTSA